MNKKIILGFITEHGYRITYEPSLCDICGCAGMKEGSMHSESAKKKATRTAHFIVHRRVPQLFRSGGAPPACRKCLASANLWEPKEVKVQ